MAPSNLEFLRTHGLAGRIGLVGGDTVIDRGIRSAQKVLMGGKKRSAWSHVLIFEGERIDGHPWMIESDFDTAGLQFRNGVQENRIDKYADEKAYPNLAVLDFSLAKDQVRSMLVTGLDFISKRQKYAVGGLVETYIAIVRKRLDKERKRDDTVCSSFVATLYESIGIRLVPGVAIRHTTPEHVARTTVPHERHELIRQPD